MTQPVLLVHQSHCSGSGSNGRGGSGGTMLLSLFSDESLLDGKGDKSSMIRPFFGWCLGQ